MRFRRRIDYQRTLAEDPTIIRAWFALVRNMIAKYGILESDIYNFDETGFQMGVVRLERVVTGTDKRNRPKTIQPGNREWVTIIQGIGALGQIILPLIIFAGKQHLSTWYEGNDISAD